MKILNFGSLNVDHIYQVEHFVQPGETLAAARQNIVPGGKGLNQSIALARAGAQVWHAGCVGIGGDGLYELLAENGIHTDYLRKTEEIQGNAIIQVDASGENCILLYGGSNRAIIPDQVNETVSEFGEGDYLILQNETSCLREMIETAAARGLQIVLNPSPFEEWLRELDYRKISWLLINQVEAEQLTGEREPEQVWEYIHGAYPRLKVVLTMGGAGACCFTEQERLFQPAVQTKVADTTAAGDTFTGYFLAGVTAGKSLDACLKQAAAAAALSVAKEGASVSIPWKDQVEEILHDKIDDRR